MADVWTDEKLKQLKVLAAEGLSALQIAHALGDTSRSAIIGKIHRLKGTDGAPTLAQQPGSSQNRAPRVAGGISRKPRPAILRQQEAEPPVSSVTGAHTTLETLQANQCRWPIGDPLTPDFCYCGHATHQNYPYCEAHAARAYQPRDKK